MRPLKVSGVQDYQHPPDNALSYDNQVVGVIYDKNYAYFNIMMSDGNNGTIHYDNKQEIKMTRQEPVAKIVVY